MKYIIEDWAGNTIKERSKSGLLITPEFETFQDGWDYIYTKFPNGENAEWDDLYVVPKGVRP
jgi:hypothetical protein